jgi:hypothetical protein
MMYLNLNMDLFLKINAIFNDINLQCIFIIYNTFSFNLNFELNIFWQFITKLLWGDGGNHCKQVCCNDKNIGTHSNIESFVPTWWHYTKILFLKDYNGIVRA